MPVIRLGLAQTNPTVGALVENLSACLKQVQKAHSQGANLVVFGELAATGYPIEDLAHRVSFLKDAELAIGGFAKDLETSGFGQITVVLGHPKFATTTENTWAIAQNVASVIRNGKVVATYAKHHLPNYSVFDEYRNFIAGNESVVFEIEHQKTGILICEDIWQDGGPVADLVKSQPKLILVLNGSPFEIEKLDQRFEMAAKLAKQAHSAVAYVNLVGGQDDLVFDGASFVMDQNGDLVSLAKQFDEDLLLVDLDETGLITPVTKTHEVSNTLEQIWNALVLALRDYVQKNNFKSVILGLSGGIDSAVCASLAVDAIGADRVFGVSLPSQYSSDHSKTDAADLAERLGIKLSVQPIEPAFELIENQLALDGVAAENLQARIRGLILMGLSNQHGHLVLTTGNKTELAVGYSTIYGDSVGGFAPIKDVDKVTVWQLARWRNEKAISKSTVPPIPQNTIEKPPSAELRPGQVDQDTLPEYDLLCEILDLYLVERLSAIEIVAKGFDPKTVERIIALVNSAEWKRRQGAIGPKITEMSFGRERRMPITNKYR